MDILHEDQYTFLHISRSVLLRKINAYDKSGRKSKHTFHAQNFLFEKRVAYEIKWKYTVVPGRRHMKIWRMRTACWITKATNTLRLRNTY